METFLQLAAVVAAALWVGAIAAPILRRKAREIGFLDQPDGGRKVHTEAVAYGGGLIVLVGLLAGVTAAWSVGLVPRESVGGPLTVVTTACLIVFAGLADDRFGMRGRHKLLIQVLISGFVVASGFGFTQLSLFGQNIELGVFGGVIGVCWLLMSINAFNLIDGVDGLATFVGLVLCLALATISIAKCGASWEAALLLAFAGGLLAFLPYNWSPATVYLGDAGSMLIGFVLGVLALRCAVKEAATVAAAPMVGLWAILLFDTVAAVLRRKLTGRSIYHSDRGHIHHRMKMHGLSDRQIMLSIGGLCALTSAAGAAGSVLGHDWIGLAAAGVVIAALAATRVFGHVEFSLLGRKLIGAVRTDEKTPKSAVVQLQGNPCWDELWATLLDSVERFSIQKLSLNLHLARAHQDFYASWSSSDDGDGESDKTWRAERPFHYDGQVAGRLSVSIVKPDSASDGYESCRLIDFLEFAANLDGQVAAVIQSYDPVGDTVDIGWINPPIDQVPVLTGEIANS